MEVNACLTCQGAGQPDHRSLSPESTSEGLLLLPVVLSGSTGGATTGTGKGAMNLSDPSQAAKEGYCYQ